MNVGESDLGYRRIPEQAPGRRATLKSPTKHEHFHDQTH